MPSKKPKNLQGAITNFFESILKSKQLTALAVLVIFCLGGVVSIVLSHAASVTATLTLSPASQTVTDGSDVTINVIVNTGGNGVNTVQSVLNYSSTDFSFVSATVGSSFSNLIDTPSTGSISFTASNTTAVTGTSVTAATIVLQSIATGTTPATLASVCPNGNYALTCSAVYDATTSANDLSTVSSASYTVNYPAPSAPTGLASSNVTTTSAKLSWTASTDTGGPGLGGYYVYRYVTSAGASSAAKVGTVSSSTTTYTDNALAAGTNYTYYVEAYDTASTPDISAASSTLAVSTAVLPSVPTALTKGNGSETTTTLSWTGSTDTGGPGLGGYYLFRYATASGSSSATKIATLNSTTTTYIDSGLTANTSYSYYVEAYDTASTPDVSAASTTLATTTSNIVGDLDGDNSVTGHDLSLLLSHYGGNYVPAEFDGTTTVEGHDLSMLLVNYGK
jgi:hypothetical protein